MQKDSLNIKIQGYCQYVVRSVKNFREKNYSDSALNGRKSAEAACKIIFYNAFNANLAESKIKDKTLKELITQIIRDSLVERKVINTLESLQIIGNKAAHDNTISKEEGSYTLNGLHLLTSYLFDDHLKIKWPSDLNFDVSEKENEPRIIKEIIVQETVIREKIDQEKERELFEKIKILETGSESEKGKYDQLISEIEQSRKEFREFSEDKKNTEKTGIDQNKNKNILIQKRKKIFVSLLIVLMAIAFFVNFYSPKKSVSLLDSPVNKLGDTIYIAINKLQILQDNPSVDFKIGEILASNIQVKGRGYPIKIIYTDFQNIDLSSDSTIVKHVFSLGYDQFYFGKLYETALNDSNELHINGYVTSNTSRSKKIKFKTLSDSIFIKEINDQANIPIVQYGFNYISAKTIGELEKIILSLTYYSEENRCWALNLLIEKNLSLYNLEKAMNYINYGLKQFPQSLYYLIKKGDVLCEKLKYDSSEFYFNKALLADSLNSETYLHYANLLCRKREIPQAEALAFKAIKLNKQNYLAWFVMADISYNFKRDYQKTKYYALKCFQIEKKYRKNNFLLAESYAFSSNGLDSARYYYGLCLSKDSSETDVLNALATLFLNYPALKGKSEYLYNKAKKTDNKQNDRNDYGLGKTAFEKGDYNTAIECLERVIASQPGNSEILSCIAQSYYMLGKYEKGLYYSELNLFADSSHFLPVYNYVINLSFAKPHQYNKIRHYFEICRKLEPNDIIMLHYYGDYLYTTGHYKECVVFCESALKKMPDHKLKQLAANSCFILKDYRNAIAHLEYLHLMRPDNDTVMIQLSQCYLQSTELTQFKKAGELIKKVFLLNPKGAFQNLLMAKFFAFGKVPEQQEALEYYKKAKLANRYLFDKELEDLQKKLYEEGIR